MGSDLPRGDTPHPGPKLVEGVDYTMEGDKLVFTAHYLLKRGYCCNSGCRHCPYGDNAPNIPIDIIGIKPRGE